MRAVFKKEVIYFFSSLIGFVVPALFAAFTVFIFVKDIFIVGSFSFVNFFSVIPWIFMIFIPAVAMRAFAEERKRNTLEVLLSLPVFERDIVLGKFFAAFFIVIIGVLLTLPLPIVLFYLAKIYPPEVIVGYLGVVFLAASFLSFSLYISSKTNSQILAFLLSALSLFFLLVLSSDFAASVVPENILSYVNFIFPSFHFEPFTKGLIPLPSVLYFLSFVLLFLFLTVLELERKR